jgi:hypothetical protein
MTDFQTITIIAGSSGTWVVPGDNSGPVLLTNLDPKNTIYLCDINSVDTQNSNANAPLPAGATVIFDNTSPVFASTLTTQSATIGILPGGIAFYQFIELIAKTIIINASTGNGLFVYNGTGAAGNPPILSVVAPGTTADPFGNAVLALLTVGLSSSAHVQFDSTGDISVINAAGLTTIYISPTNQFIGFYPTGYGIGAPVITIAAVSGNDGQGNSFFEGFEVHGPSGSYTLLSNSGLPIIALGTGASEEVDAAFMQTQINNAGASEYLSLLMTSAIEADGSYAGLALNSIAKDSSQAAAGDLYYSNGTTQFELLFWSNDGLSIQTLGGVEGWPALGVTGEVAQYNFTTTTLTRITESYTIPAGDANVGTVYRITARGNGTQGTTADAMVFQGMLGGVGGGECTVPATFVGASAIFGWKAILEVTCYSTGSGGTAGVSLQVIAGGANTVGTVAYGWSITIAFDTAVANNFFLQGSWKTTTGVPVGATRDDSYERVMQ